MFESMELLYVYMILGMDDEYLNNVLAPDLLKCIFDLEYIDSDDENEEEGDNDDD